MRQSVVNMEGFPVDDLPDDVFQTIFNHVDGLTLVKCCILVCKRWKVIIDLNALWKAKCDKRGILKPNMDIEVDFKRLFFLNPYNRNLLKNGNASGLSKCWATSYQWCSKEQLIDLNEEGCDFRVIDTLKPTIVVSESTTARADCASCYVMSVVLLDKKKKKLQSWVRNNEVKQWLGGQWTKVAHEFVDYPSGVRYIKFLHQGKDRQFWIGHYGPKFTGASVKFKFK